MRTLSWPGNFLITRLFPGVWITGWGVGTIWLLVSPETIDWNGVRGAAPPGAGWLFLAAWVCGSGLLLGLFWRLRRVRIDDDALYVSNYLREVRVPLSEVTSVRQPMWDPLGAITVELRSATPLGRRIRFVPRGRRVRWLGEEGEVVQELRAAVAPAAIEARAG